MDKTKAVIPVVFQQDKLIELPDFLADVSVSIGARTACDWHETDCNYTCQSSCEKNTQCGRCQTIAELCQTTCEVYIQHCTTTCEKTLQCIGCQSGCQGCQTACEKSSQGSPPTSSGTITINSADITDTTITVHLSSIPGATWYNIVWKIKGGPGLDQEVRNGLSYTFTGLTPEKTYIFNYYGKNNYGSGPYATSVSATTLKKKPVVVPWSWDISNGVGGAAGTATAAKTQAAHRAILNEGYMEDFSYKAWNDLVNKINEVVLAIGATWANTYATFGDAKMSGAGQELTVAKYNAAKQNVGSHYSTGIPEVNGTTGFTWSYIDKLAAKLNEWIASL